MCPVQTEMLSLAKQRGRQKLFTCNEMESTWFQGISSLVSQCVEIVSQGVFMT